MNARVLAATLGLAAILLAAGGALAVTIETVPVGNPGNAVDTEVMIIDGSTGYGRVDYAYNIGKYEVTAGQYTEFLNAADRHVKQTLPCVPFVLSGIWRKGKKVAME